MAIATKSSPNNNNTITVALTDRLTWAESGTFLQLADFLKGRYTNYVIDMSGVIYIDSSALGMLLLFRDKIDLSRQNMIIRAPKSKVAASLRMSRFDELFHIEE